MGGSGTTIARINVLGLRLCALAWPEMLVPGVFRGSEGVGSWMCCGFQQGAGESVAKKQQKNQQDPCRSSFCLSPNPPVRRAQRKPHASAGDEGGEATEQLGALLFA